MPLSILLRCIDLQSTRDFYQSALGFDSTATAENTLTVSMEGSRLVFTSQDLWTLEPRLSGTIYITVVDVDAYFAAIKDHVTLAWALQDMPYGSREFAIVDCNGYLIAFQQEGTGSGLRSLWQTFALRLFTSVRMQQIIRQIATEIRVGEHQVRAAVELLDGGATVPFIARCRKEATGGRDDIQLRELASRLDYLRELESRRESILKSIDEQGKLTPELRAAVMLAPTKQELEDLYLPFKQRRRTKGLIAREFGIEPLADKLWADPTLDPVAEAAAFTRPPEVLDDGKPGADFSTAAAVLDGVRDILSERWAEDPALVQNLREWLWAEGLLRSKK
eukprot:gene40849-54069_t